MVIHPSETHNTHIIHFSQQSPGGILPKLGMSPNLLGGGVLGPNPLGLPHSPMGQMPPVSLFRWVQAFCFPSSHHLCLLHHFIPITILLFISLLILPNTFLLIFIPPQQYKVFLLLDFIIICSFFSFFIPCHITTIITYSTFSSSSFLPMSFSYHYQSLPFHYSS